MKKILFILFMCLPYLGISQQLEDVNPYRIGLKAGFPIGIGAEFEFVTPWLGNRIAPYISYGILPSANLNSKYLEIGSNIYLGSRAKGGYVSASYGNLNAEFGGLSGDNDNGDYFTDGVSKEELTSFNLKLGWKYGKALYLRLEGGYAIGKLPEKLEVTGLVDGQEETFYLSFEEISEFISGNGYPILSISVGYAF